MTTPQQDASTAVTELGAVVSNSRHTLGQTGKLLWALVVLDPLIGILMIVGAWNSPSGRVTLGVGGGVMIVTSPLFLMLLLRLRKSRLTVHDHGVEICHGRRIARFRYEDIREFSFSLERQSTVGAYAGLMYQLTLVTGNEDNPEKHRWSSIENEPQPALEDLRDRITGILVQRLAQELAASGRVVWTPLMTLTKEGVEYKRMDWKAGEKSEYLAFADVDRTELANGDFVLYREGEKKPPFQCSQSGPNFYPGYVLFLDAHRQATGPEST